MRPFIQELSFRRYQVHRDLAILLVMVAVCAAPFLSQPFHMDDNFYMEMARNARAHRLYPNDVPYVFEGRYLPDMGSHSHPPLVTYFLAMIQRFSGEGPDMEWVYHLCALIFPVLAVIAFYFVAARYLERPLWAALVMACCPVFLVMQHTLMADVPAFAFWLLAVAFFLRATDRRSCTLYTASSVCQFAAMFTSYQCFALTPLLGAWLFRRKTGAAAWLYLLPAPCLMAGWFFINRAHYHRWLLGDTVGFIGSRHAWTANALWTKLLAVLGYQGWLILFPFFFIYVFGRGLRGRLLVLATLCAVWICQLGVPEYRLLDKAVFVVGIVTGVFILARLASFSAASLRDGEAAMGIDPPGARFLGLWYFGVLAYCILILAEGSSRYILPLVPPVLICFFRRLEVSEVPEYRSSPRPILNSAMLASGSLVLSLAWGMALSHADLEFARIYPRAANEFARITGGMPSYYAGEWGFRYYFSRSGVRQMPVDESQVGGGSFLALPRLALPYDIPADLRSMTMPIQTLTYELDTPLRILDWQSPAGFYSTGWGLNPFSLSRRILEEVEVRQVNFLVERLPCSRLEGDPPVKPWPGYLLIHEKNPLAILAKPGTRLIYPWTESEPVVLEMMCGVEAYTDGSKAEFTFSIRELKSSGEVMSSFSRTLKPGTRNEDRGWIPLRLLLQGTDQGAGSLILEFQCRGKDNSGTGAFAGSVLRKPE